MFSFFFNLQRAQSIPCCIIAQGLREFDCRMGCRIIVVWTRLTHPSEGLDCRMDCRILFPKVFARVWPMAAADKVN